MTTSGSQIGGEIRRQPTPSIYDPGGGALHINPHRTRTPRTFSITAHSYGRRLEFMVMLDEIESNLSTPNGRSRDVETPSSEKTPLIAAKEITENISISDEHLRPTQPPIVKLKELIRSIRWAPRDARWRAAVFRLVKIVSLFIITIICCIQLMVTNEEENIFRTTVVEANKTRVLDHDLCAGEMAVVRVEVFGRFYETKDENDTAPQFYVNLSSAVIVNSQSSGTRQRKRNWTSENKTKMPI